MIPDLDIFCIAQVVAIGHGENVPIVAAMWADAMLEKGDVGGYTDSKRNIKILQQSQTAERGNHQLH